MKKLLLVLIAIAVSTNTIAQELKHSRAGFEPLVIEVEGKKAPEIYSNLKGWIQASFVNPEEVITADTENKTLRFNGFFEFKGLVTFGYRYTVLIQIKEGRFRVSIQNVIGVESNSAVENWLRKDGSVKGMGKKQYHKMFNRLQLIVNRLHLASTGLAEEDW